LKGVLKAEMMMSLLKRDMPCTMALRTMRRR